jgi:hypothetical protein
MLWTVVGSDGAREQATRMKRNIAEPANTFMEQMPPHPHRTTSLNAHYDEFQSDRNDHTTLIRKHVF